MIEAVALDTAQHPPAIVLEARSRSRRKRRDSRDPPRRSRARAAALFVGAVVILTDDRGQPYSCEIIGQDAEGDWLCLPVTQ